MLRAPIVLCALLLVGCSSHPLPDDLSSASTYSIVLNIRCEVKHQVEKRLQELIDTSSNPIVRQYRVSQVRDYVTQFGQLETLRFLARMDPGIAYKVVKYGSIVIGYSFSFGITETNTKSASSLFGVSFPNTTVGVKSDQHAKLVRHATRTFALSDSFLDLIALDCTEAQQRARNLTYPIVGSIGADRIIDTYLDLGKSGATSQPVSGVAGPFKDVIVYTTEIAMDIRPTITIAPLAKSFRLASATGVFADSRVDVHSVTIVIPFPSVDDRMGSGLDTQALANFDFRDAIRRANRVIAYEFCVDRAINGASGALPGVHKAPEEYCKESDFR